MIGSDYVALTRISDSSDDTLAAVGDTCDRVPAEAIGWLVESGCIAEAGTVTPPPDDTEEGDDDG